MSTTLLPPTERTTLHRAKKRGSHDRAVIHAILDAGKVCQVGFCMEGRPFVIPTAYARDGERLLIHGSVASRMVQVLTAGAEACITVTLLDGLVLARSQFHHSMNYRSVVAFGRMEVIDDEAGKRRALDLLVEHLTPGRSTTARPPNVKELNATAVLALPLTEASAKIRSGPPLDDERDMAVDVWAGVIPLTLTAGSPIPSPDLREGIAYPV